jgi:hypothetical protein
MSIKTMGKGISTHLDLVALNQRQMERMTAGDPGMRRPPASCVCDCDCYNNPEGMNTAQVSAQAPDVSQW